MKVARTVRRGLCLREGTRLPYKVSLAYLACVIKVCGYPRNTLYARQTITSSHLQMCNPLDISNGFCYTIPTLVDRVLTSTLPALSPVLPVRRYIRADERYLVLHIESLSASAVGSPFCIHTFRRKGGVRHGKRQGSRRFASELPRKQVSLKNRWQVWQR